MMKRLTPILALALASTLSAQTPSGTGQFKGVFEPVSYTEDLDLLDVFFVNANVGWVAGKVGTIIATTDGGATWKTQLGGDPQGRADNIRLIRFVDERTGWAVQGTPGLNEKLLHTSDGENWEEIGTPPISLRDLVFTSRTRGYASGSSGRGRYADVVFRTTDGGRTWKQAWTCNAKVQLEGLNRQLGCHITQFNFVSPQVGFAVARNNAFGMGSEPPPLIAKTTDGGENWEVVMGPGVADKDGVTSIAFVDERTGFARLTSKKLHMTRDGGATWRGIIAEPGIDIRFADPGVGWAVEVGRLDPDVWYTTDGGARWNSRTIKFPATVKAFSFPRRDRAYFVGENGMVFRYSVVPVSRTTKPNSVAAPAMPAFETVLADQVGQLEQVVTEIRTALGITAPAGNAGAGTGASSAAGSTGSGASGEALSAPLAPASAFTAGCCQKSFSRLEVILGALSKTLPEFIGKYKNLNLLLAAVRMGAELPDEYRSVKGGLSAFRKAQDKESAAAALAGVSAALSKFKQTTAISMQTQLPPAGG
jgi:photosystem II stability/assembly factor-like uncharacterized protein